MFVSHKRAEENLDDNKYMDSLIYIAHVSRRYGRISTSKQLISNPALPSLAGKLMSQCSAALHHVSAPQCCTVIHQIKNPQCNVVLHGGVANFRVEL